MDATETKTKLAAVPDLPTGLLSAIARAGWRREDLVFALYADLAPDGRYGEQWFLLTANELAVFVTDGDGSHYDLRHRLRRSDIKSAKAETAIGNAHLEVTINDEPRLLLRYSNSVSERFARMARYLDGIAKGRELPLPLGDDES